MLTVELTFSNYIFLISYVYSISDKSNRSSKMLTQDLYSIDKLQGTIKDLLFRIIWMLSTS